MSRVVITVSSKGQVVLPAEVRARLGLSAGAKLELEDEPDGLHLKVVRSVPATDVGRLAGMVKAKSKGRPRRLGDFDAAALTRKSHR
jgi:AbrB family looped-hinge helix DNA binding protein